MVDYIGRALVADALREWRDQLHERATVSPLRDLASTQANLVDLRGGHPSGLAQLFASRPTPISSLLRDAQVREAGLHRGRLILDEAERVRAATGAWTAALVIGTVAWVEDDTAVEMPLLMRPVGLDRYRADDVQITLRDAVDINPVFAAMVRERADEAGLQVSLPAVTGGRDFDPRPLWEQVRGLTALFGEDLEVRDKLLLGAFDDPEQRLLDDLDDCDPVISASTVLAAAAGDHDARAQLSDPLPAFPRGDRDPFAERGIGDLDDVQFAALDLIATGRDVFLQAPPGADVVGTAAAIAADGAASGKTVAVVGGHDRTLAAVGDRLRLLGAKDLVIDGTVTSWNADARARLLESITMGTPQVDDTALRSSGERLLRSRAELHRRFDALHRSHRPWGVSVFEAVQAIVRLTTSEPQPGTALRLSTDASAAVAEHGFAAVAAAIVAELRPDAEPGAEVESPVEEELAESEPWWTGHVEDADGARLDEALAGLTGRSIPKMRAEAAIAAHETGVDEADSLNAWFEQVSMFEDLREILEVFSPAVFHRSLHDLVAATAPHGSSRFVELPRRERRALMRRGVELLRPGRGKETLHDDLVRAHDLALRWRAQCSAGGWPTVPDDYDLFADRVAEAGEMWAVLRDPASAASGVEDLGAEAWDDMAAHLDRLTQGRRLSFDETVAEPVDIDLDAVGLTPLVDDVRARDASDAQVRRDLEFAWWAAAFDGIVTTEPALTEYGALGSAVDQFRQADADFGEARIGPLMRAAAERRRNAIARHPDLARDLFAALVEGGEASVKELWRDFGALTTALRPVVIAKAEQVSRLAPPSRAFDVAVVVAAESLALAELVPTLARAKQVVVVGDARAATRSAVAGMAAMLPHATLHAAPQPRDVRVTAVLSRAAYGRSIEALPAADGGGSLEVTYIDGVGAPVAGAQTVESTRAEIAAVVEHVAHVFDSLPRRSMVLVAGNGLHAARLRDALLERSARLAAAVPVEVLGDVAGHLVDHVVLSLGFARDARGTVPERLGALSEEWGREALVQALVASRSEVAVFSALTADQLPAGAADAEVDGVDDLRDLLLAAGERAIAPERPEPAPSDWLLADVAQRVRREGYGVHVRYGNGPDAVPMAVGGKHDRGYTLAVVTDEAAPAGSASLRDRMRWQRSSWEALGWTVVPLWTLDVFMDPDAAATAVRSALEAAQPAHVQESLELELAPAPSAGSAPSTAASAPVGPATAEPAAEVAGVFDFDGDDEPLAADDVAEAEPEPSAPSELVGADAADEDAADGTPADDQPGEDEPDAEPDAEDVADGDDEPEEDSSDDGEPDDEAEASDDAESDDETEGDDEAGDDAAEGEDADDEPAEPERKKVPTMGFGVPKLVTNASARQEDKPPAPPKPRGTDRPLIPTRASEDRDEGWGGGYEGGSRDDDLKRERPPHW